MNLQEIYDAGFGVMEYNITNDRQAYRYRNEKFNFVRSAAWLCWQASEQRDIPPTIRVCRIEKLREIKVAHPQDCK